MRITFSVTGMLVVASFHALPSASLADFTCQSEEDCHLNGICTPQGACVCDAPWTGSEDCGVLSFRPVSATPPECGYPGCIYRGDGKTTDYSWGGNILFDDKTQQYFLTAAEFVNMCDLGTWTTNSQVALAVSKTLEGPYTKHSVPVGTWAHNPQSIKLVDSDGTPTYVIYTLGNGTFHGHVKDCRKGVKPEPEHASHVEHEHVHAFVLHYANSIDGPWESKEIDLPDFDPAWNLDNWNPAPWVLGDGHSIRLMVHTDIQPWAGEVIYEASDFRGPYVRVSGDVAPGCDKCNEDPTIWQDKRGNWHALYHRMFDPNGTSPIPMGWSGGHVYSADGITWSNWSNFDPRGRAFNTSVPLSNGSFFELGRRERPKLVFAADGVTPTHLITSAQVPGNGDTYTLMVPLDVDV